MQKLLTDLENNQVRGAKRLVFFIKSGDSRCVFVCVHVRKGRCELAGSEPTSSHLISPSTRAHPSKIHLDPLVAAG